MEKLERFLQFCEENHYLERLSDGQSHRLDFKKVLSDHPEKLFRKKNPIGFHANGLASLGEANIKPVFEH